MFDYFMAERGRLRSLGSALVSVGGGWIIVGLLGRVATQGASLIAHLGHLSEQTLADLYPLLPTWWVPESLIGALPACFLLASGVWAAVRGRQLDELYW